MLSPVIPWAHPRACGENAIPAQNDFFEYGSSPRVRGKHERLLHVAGGGRLIPAHAGKTTTRPLRRLSCRAHPRACGENYLIAPDSGAPLGSSPRVRGKRSAHFPSVLSLGLIPARAGKTLNIPHAALRHRAHPRACGENVALPLDAGGLCGSSPRVRGKRRYPRGHDVRRGLIPARAGKTS